MSKLSKKIRADRRTVFVGMSGGVDSSVTAYLLKEKGYNVVGVFMRCYNLDGCAERDAEDARRVAERIGIPFYVWDFEEEYKKRVVEYMIEGYRAGITPNPDVMCNREIKFGLFLEKALAAGADYVATGHYVKLKNGSLFAARDKNKDQSYFLWTLTKENLKRCLFPIGGYLKSEVRAIARKAGLSTAEKKDSQGVCFLGDISIQDFLKSYIPEKKGALITTTGEIIGEHQGAAFYTIGQRHLGVAYAKAKKGNTQTQPFYVAAKDIKSNTVIVAEGNENQALYKKEINIMSINNPGSVLNAKKMTISVFARVRYRQPLAKANIEFHIKNKKMQSAKVTFEKPQKFVASGQSAVWYSKAGEMLGGGVIV